MATNYEKLCTIVAIITGLLSLGGSSLLMCTILRSKKKLSVPYRRIIFGTSIFDVFQSLGLATSTFLSPKGVHIWASGNTVTCDIQGFFTTVGAIGVPLYLCSLCIYYFCIIKLNMRNKDFKKLEPCLHAVPILYGFFCGIFALANQYLNNAGSVCYVAPSPITCEIIPGVECTRGEGASKFRLLFLTYPSMIIFGIVCSIMAVIAISAKKIEKRQRRYSFPHSISSLGKGRCPDECLNFSTEVADEQLSTKSSIQAFYSRLMRCVRLASTNEKENEDNISSEMNHSPSPVHRPYQRRRNSRYTSRTGEISKQALLYVGSYVLTYGFVWGQSIYMIVTSSRPPLALRFLSSFFFPLQGFINIFIYCRPHIVSLRRNSPGEYSWFQAYLAVLKSGGDEPLTHQQRRITTLQRSQCQPSTQSGSKGDSTSSKLTSMESIEFGSNDRISALLLRAEGGSPTALGIDIEHQSPNKMFQGPLPLHNLNCIKRSEYLERNAIEKVLDRRGEDEIFNQVHECFSTDESSVSEIAHYHPKHSQEKNIEDDAASDRMFVLSEEPKD